MRVAFAVCFCFAFAAGASAQDDRSVGLTIGYPSAVGVIWQVVDRVAIRTDTFFSSSWTDTDPADAGDEFLRIVGTTSSTSGRTFGVGVSVLVTVAKWERLRAYLAPRAAYARSSNESEISFSVQPAGHSDRDPAGDLRDEGHHADIRRVIRHSIWTGRAIRRIR